MANYVGCFIRYYVFDLFDRSQCATKAKGSDSRNDFCNSRLDVALTSIWYLCKVFRNTSQRLSNHRKFYRADVVVEFCSNHHHTWRDHQCCCAGIHNR